MVNKSEQNTKIYVNEKEMENVCMMHANRLQLLLNHSCSFYSLQFAEWIHLLSCSFYCFVFSLPLSLTLLLAENAYSFCRFAKRKRRRTKLVSQALQYTLCATIQMQKKLSRSILFMKFKTDVKISDFSVSIRFKKETTTERQILRFVWIAMKCTMCAYQEE